MGFPYLPNSKKDGRVCWISDFHCLNSKLLKWTCFFLPSIPAIMQKRAGLSFITKIDLSMGFYTFDNLTLLLKNFVSSVPLLAYFSTFTSQWVSPIALQSAMHPLFQDMPDMECFIDDIGIFTSGSLEHQSEILSQVLLRLEESGFTVNPLKCAWWAVTVTATDYLGFLINTNGLKQIPSKKLSGYGNTYLLFAL